MNMKRPPLSVCLTLLAGFAFVSGTLGFLEANPGYSFRTAMLAAVQLFAFNSGVIEGPVPWKLEFARWAAVVSSGVFIGSVLRSLRGGIQRMSLRIQRSTLGGLWNRPLHVVVGLGQKGLHLAEDLHRNGIAVFAVDRDETRVELARGKGIPAIVADGTLSETHRLLPWHRVERMVLLMGGDEANLMGTLVARQVSASRRVRGPSIGPRFHVHLPTLALRNLLYRQDAFPGDEVRLFNYHERLARRILLRYPVEALSCDSDPTLHTGFVDPELGLQGVSIAEEQAPQIYLRPSPDFTAPLISLLAREAHFPVNAGRRWRRTRVFVVDAEAGRHCIALQEMYPALKRVGDQALIDLEPLIPAVGESPAQLVGRRVRGIAPGTPITVILDVHDPGKALAEALTLLDEAQVPSPGADSVSRGKHAMPALRCLFDFADEPAIRGLVESNPCFRHYIRPVPSFSECCGCGNLYDDSMDRLARIVHENYDRKGEQPWAGLSLELQESNRAAAAHIGLVLRALGRSRGEVLADGFDWSPVGLESLAEAEHRRWSAQKLMDGWCPEPSLGEGQDRGRKLHGCLDRPYDRLSEGMKERDRDNVRQIPALLRALGGIP